MGQKVRPVGFRTGIYLGWKSNWCASKRDFPDLLVEAVPLPPPPRVSIVVCIGGGSQDVVEAER
jgi:hypothetical protein